MLRNEHQRHYEPIIMTEEEKRRQEEAVKHLQDLLHKVYSGTLIHTVRLKGTLKP